MSVEPMSVEPDPAGYRGGVVPLVDTTLLPDGPGPAAAVRSAHRWYEHLIGLWACAIIEASHDLGVFDALAPGPGTSDDLAAAIHADPRATRVLLDALYAYDLVGRAEGEDGCAVYALTPDSQACLLQGELFSLAGKIGQDRRFAWSAWRDLASAVRSGSLDAAGTEQRNQLSDADYEVLARSLNFWAPPIVEILAGALADLPSWQPAGAPRMLDVGCGSGVYSHLLIQRFPGLSATGLDTARIVPIAAEQARRLGVAGAFRSVGGDFFADDWGSGFDLVLFANIFHLQTPESACALLAKAATAVAGDGVIAIVDHVLDDGAAPQSTQDRFFRLFATLMLATGGGDAYSAGDYDAWLAQCGLRRYALLDTPMHRVLLARRT
jgi:SAM-dependent methyltransferase